MHAQTGVHFVLFMLYVKINFHFSVNSDRSQLIWLYTVFYNRFRIIEKMHAVCFLGGIRYLSELIHFQRIQFLKNSLLQCNSYQFLFHNALLECCPFYNIHLFLFTLANIILFLCFFCLVGAVVIIVES